MRTEFGSQRGQQACQLAVGETGCQPLRAVLARFRRRADKRQAGRQPPLDMVQDIVGDLAAHGRASEQQPGLGEVAQCRDRCARRPLVPERFQLPAGQLPRELRRIGKRAEEPRQPPQRSPARFRGLKRAQAAAGAGPLGERPGQGLMPAWQRQPRQVERPAPAVVSAEGHRRPAAGRGDRIRPFIAACGQGRYLARPGAAPALLAHRPLPAAGGGPASSPTSSSGVSLGSSHRSGTSAIRVSISSSCRACR